MGYCTRAAFLAVGSELLRTDRLDTNSLLVGRKLLDRGVELVEKRCVGDDEQAIAQAVNELLGKADLVVVSGGLGPTADDQTRAGVARALGRKIRRDEKLVASLESHYRRLGRNIPNIALRMAEVIDGSEVLPNPRGTAPGLWIQDRGRVLILLPGVPEELEAIFTVHVLPRFPGSRRVLRTLHISGRFESEVEQKIEPLYNQFGRENITILASYGTVDLVLFANSEDDLLRMEHAFTHTLGDDIFGRDGETLAQVVLDGCAERGWLLATAESCTGGLVGAMLTKVPGASRSYLGGIVAYANSLKTSILGVEEQLLGQVGAVSREVAETMVEGALRLGAQCGLAITGIAGPSGGTAEKPVGTVHVAVSTPLKRAHRQYSFGGSRTTIQKLAANFALDLLRRALLEN